MLKCHFVAWDYPENLQVVFCPNISCPFETFMCLELLSDVFFTATADSHTLSIESLCVVSCLFLVVLFLYEIKQNDC